MGTSLFALMRGADGRSLARALIVLLLANVVVGGFHLGAMAAAGDGAGVICTLASGAAASHDPAAPQQDNDCPCCALGCALACGHASAVPVEPSLAAMAVPPPAQSVAAPVPHDHAAPSLRLTSSNGPRSPPLPA
jgi:hypothetical protein